MRSTETQAPSDACVAARREGCDGGLVAAFGLLGKRWNGLILGTLAEAEAGFAELRRGIGGITDSMLSDRLTELTTAGLLERRVTDTRPPGVSYRLTAAGRALVPILKDLGTWASEHLPERCTEAVPPRRTARIGR